MARRGARSVTDPPTGPDSASAAWRASVEKARGDEAIGDEWIDHGDVRDEATGAVARGTSPSRERAPRKASGSGPRPDRPRTTDAPVSRSEGRSGPAPLLGDVTGSAATKLLTDRLKDATKAFERDRFIDAQRALRPLAQRFPGAAAVRELYGLTLYRLGRWRDAIRELEAFRSLTGSAEQHPVLADSYRALGRFSEVADLWRELGEKSPSAEIVAEGRIVAAGALADQQRLADGIRLLEPAVKAVKRARPHHLRMAYALADLYERAGDVPKARQLFARVAAADPELADVASRLRTLG